MEEPQIRLLEERIEKAISFIEQIKAREKKLVEEKRQLSDQISKLKKTIQEKETAIDELQANQNYLKERIESILDRLESIELLETTISEEKSIYEASELDSEVVEDASMLSTDEKDGINDEVKESKIIEEEQIVDLKSIEKDTSKDSSDKGTPRPVTSKLNTSKDERILKSSKEQDQKLKSEAEKVSEAEKKESTLFSHRVGQTEPIENESENTLFDVSSKKKESIPDRVKHESKSNWSENNPFIEI